MKRTQNTQRILAVEVDQHCYEEVVTTRGGPDIVLQIPPKDLSQARVSQTLYTSGLTERKSGISLQEYIIHKVSFYTVRNTHSRWAKSVAKVVLH